MTIAPPELREAVTLRRECAVAEDVSVEMLIVIVGSDRSELPAWLAPYSSHVAGLGEGEFIKAYRTPTSDFQANSVVVLALPTSSREPARMAGRHIGAENRALSTFAVTGFSDHGAESPAFAFLSGFAEGRYRFGRYRSTGAPDRAEVRLVTATPENSDALTRDLATAEIVEASVRWCRELTNTPARDLTPAVLAHETAREAQRAGASARVFDETWLAAEQFAGLVSVGAGSPNPPRLVELRYCGSEAKDTPPIVLVGKGITFDSGGLSLKKASAMMEMKSDMAGAATAAAVVQAIARLQPANVHVVALLAIAENLPGAQALRPGDIIRHRNGRTTEVVNTDCEGRLVMSDVLAWAAESAPAAIIDIATLTYSTISALGIEITSAMGTGRALIAALRDAGEITGDHYWELPLWEPYRRHIDSPFADLRNEDNGEGASAITAALFLREFVADIPWVHLDTGGTAYLDEETNHLEAGATGSCVRSIIRLLLDQNRTTQGGES